MKIKQIDTQKTPSQIIQTSYAAKLDTSATALIMDMLSKFYANPLTAAIREYTSNGIDIHRECGMQKPVEVMLPTKTNPILSIRDFGEGLDYFDILTIYANFGTSSKRESDEAIGGFGIGSKSGLAIADAVYVESIKQGLYNRFVLERTVNGIFTRFIDENVDAKDKESGTTITINVKSDYVPENTNSIQTYQKVLAGWSKSEVICISDFDKLTYMVNDNRIPDTWSKMGNHYMMLPEYNTLGHINGAIIGGVLYTDLEELLTLLQTSEKPKIIEQLKLLNHQDYVLVLDIDKTKVSYSREHILYKDDPDTKSYIKDCMLDLTQSITDELSTLQAQNLDPSTYVRTLDKRGINCKSNANNVLGKRALNTPNYNLSEEIAYHNLIVDDWYYSTAKHNNEIPQDKRDIHVILTDDVDDLYENHEKELMSTMKRLRKNCNDIVPELEYFVKHYTKTRNTCDSDWIFMNRDDAKKMPYYHTFITIEYQDLRTYLFPKIALSDEAKALAKAKCIYYINQFDTINVDDITTVMKVVNNKNCMLLPPTSCIAFNTCKNSSLILDIQRLLKLDCILTTRTQAQFKELCKALPQFAPTTDAALADMISDALQPLLWLKDDEACKLILNAQTSYVREYNTTVRHEFSNLIGLKFKLNNSHNHLPNFISKIVKKLSELDTNVKNMADFKNKLVLTTNDNNPHTMCVELKHLYSSCNNSNNIAFLTIIELQDILDAIHTKLWYNIEVLNKAYTPH